MRNFLFAPYCTSLLLDIQKYLSDFTFTETKSLDQLFIVNFNDIFWYWPADLTSSVFPPSPPNKNDAVSNSFLVVMESINLFNSIVLRILNYFILICTFTGHFGSIFSQISGVIGKDLAYNLKGLSFAPDCLLLIWT